jgi:hypothetical protein
MKISTFIGDFQMPSFQGEDTMLNRIIFNLMYYQFVYFLSSMANLGIVILPGLQRFQWAAFLSLVIIIVHACQGFPNAVKTNANLPANIRRICPNLIQIRVNENTVTFIEDTWTMKIYYNLSYYQNEYLTLMFGICGYYVCAPFQLSGVIFPIICVIIHATFGMPNVQIMDRGNFYQQFLRQTPMDYFLEEIGLKSKFSIIASDPARK